MINANADIMINVELVVTSKWFVTTYMYAENPIKANADFNKNDAHNPRPLIVPTKGPNERSTYTYAPPFSGIADANSDFDNVPGKKTIPASKNASQIPGPITAAANDGRTNNPEPILAAIVTITTPFKPRVLSIVYLTSETTPEISPLSNLFVVDLILIETSPRRE